ncbi:MAG: PorT family protein [Muribaculaceae bacterium]|nr:PorT family protein [Muribaculaceae bacterium]
MKKIIFAIACLLAMTQAGAVGLINKAEVINVRLGYGIGGTAPIGLPPSIRSLNKFKLQFNPSLGIDATYGIKGPLGIMFGIQLENKGMEMDARVKDYHMEIVHGGQQLAGQFTGDVTTKVTEWMITIPIQASYRYKKVRFKLGPYISYVGSRNFSGWAHNGYLRVGNPTGPKVFLGDSVEERGEYDFTGHMRRLQAGIDAGIDWKWSSRFGGFLDLAWGLTPVHKSDFKTIEQTLYPIYGKIGVTYRLK